MSRKRLDELGPLQRAVMDVLWEAGEATVGDVRARLNRRRKDELAYTTVLSAMQKLEKLGWLRHRAEGKTYVFRPARTREEEGAKSLESFVHRVFHGDPLVLFQHLLDDADLSDGELDALKAMIEQRRQERSEG